MYSEKPRLLSLERVKKGTFLYQVMTVLIVIVSFNFIPYVSRLRSFIQLCLLSCFFFIFDYITSCKIKYNRIHQLFLHLPFNGLLNNGHGILTTVCEREPLYRNCSDRIAILYN